MRPCMPQLFLNTVVLSQLHTCGSEVATAMPFPCTTDLLYALEFGGLLHG